MKSKLVTLEEAKQMLPLLRSIVSDIRVSWGKIIEKRTELECFEKEKGSRGEEESSPGAEEWKRRPDALKEELNGLIERINNYIREVEDLGCFVEEFKRGIINFPSLYHGRKVFLCWSFGEDDVGHWHELDESFSDRVKIEHPEHFLQQQPKIHG